MERHTLRHYMNDIAHCPRLTQAETAALAQRSRSGDREARNAMVEGNLPLVITVAKLFRNRGLEWDELVAAGNMGLIRAAELYDPAEFMFSTYATRWIRSMIGKELDENHLIHVPNYMLYADVKNNPRFSDHVSKARTLKLNSEYRPDHSGRDITTPLDRHPDPRTDDDQPASHDWEAVLDRGLRSLPAAEETMLRISYGLGEPLAATASDARWRLGIGRERARQLKQTALAALREQVPQLEDQLA